MTLALHWDRRTNNSNQKRLCGGNRVLCTPAAASAVASLAFEGSKLIRMLPAKPVRAPTQSPTGTASPAIVQRMGVKMMEALMRKAPFAIVVNVKP
jgi:hypothetical protein